MATINGMDITKVSLSVKQLGPWTAKVSFVSSTPIDPNTPVTIDVSDENGNPNEWTGTIISANNDGFETHAIVVSAPWIQSQTEAKSWSNSTTIRDVINEQLSFVQAGASISSDSDETILGFRLEKWQAMQGEPMQSSMKRLMDAVPNATYSINKDGTIYIRFDEFSANGSPLSFDANDVYQVSDANEQQLSLSTTFTGIHSSLQPGSIISLVYGDQPLEANVYSFRYDLNGQGETTTIELQPTFRYQSDYIDDRVRKLLLNATFTATVKGQSGQRIDIEPDDELLKGYGIDSVELVTGFPGEIDLTTGQPVVFTFLNGDPQRPCVIGHLSNVVEQIRLGDASNFVALSNLVDSNMATIQEKFDGHTHKFTATAGSDPLTTVVTESLIVSLPSTAADKVKAE